MPGDRSHDGCRLLRVADRSPDGPAHNHLERADKSPPCERAHASRPRKPQAPPLVTHLTMDGYASTGESTTRWLRDRTRSIRRRRPSICSAAGPVPGHTWPVVGHTWRSPARDGASALTAHARPRRTPALSANPAPHRPELVGSTCSTRRPRDPARHESAAHPGAGATAGRTIRVCRRSRTARCVRRAHRRPATIRPLLPHDAVRCTPLRHP